MASGHQGHESKSDKKPTPQRVPTGDSPAAEPLSPETLGNFATPHDFPPAYNNNLRLRQRSVLQLQRDHGNTRVRRFLANHLVSPPSPAANSIQREEEEKGGGKSNGEGPGKVQGATEAFYDVSGEKLSDLTEQLKKYAGYASETYVALTIEGEVFPEKKGGKLQIKVEWKTVDHESRLPRWTGYKDACKAAQDEWDRFMTQTRKHEQTAHVEMADKWVKELGKKDTVITGKDAEELQRKLGEKQVELGEKLQKKHDACGHGVDIDAILHTEKGECSSE